MNDEHEIEPMDDRLAAGLRALGRPRMMVPQSVDDAVLAAARIRMARTRRTRRAIAWAAAAGIVLAAGLAALLPMARREAVAPAVTSAASMDVNGDGRVDVLDAFALARKIENHEPLSLKWDINGDGVVDEKDVRTIAMSAVQIARR